MNLYKENATIQNILKYNFDAYEKNNRLPNYVRDAARKMINCRTDEFGGHKYRCPNCGEDKIVYNPCHHRSCPKCSRISNEKWLNKKLSKFPDTNYYHVVFTIPQELNKYFLENKSLFTDVLFSSVKETLLGMCKNELWLGAEPGILTTFQSWGSALPIHPHIHCIVTDGGLRDKREWINGNRSISKKKGFLLPITGDKGVMGVFRSKVIYKLKGLVFKSKLSNPIGMNKEEILSELDTLSFMKWNVYIDDKVNNGKKVLKYLASYVKGGPISNKRILKVENNIVHFKYKNSKQGRKNSIMKLPLNEFIRRYLLHISESGKKLVRSYGIFSNSKKSDLNLARELLGELPLNEVEIEEVNRDVKCKECNTKMLIVEKIESRREKLRLEFEKEVKIIGAKISA